MGLDLRWLQQNLPWDGEYSANFKQDHRTFKDAEHALLHIVKAAGRVSMVIEKWDHEREVKENSKDLWHEVCADFVICAVRLANTGFIVDIERAIIDRLKEKNPDTKIFDSIAVNQKIPQPVYVDTTTGIESGKQKEIDRLTVALLESEAKRRSQGQTNGQLNLHIQDLEQQLRFSQEKYRTLCGRLSNLHEELDATNGGEYDHA